MLTKEECLKALHDIEDDCINKYCDYKTQLNWSTIEQLINEHFELLEKHKALQDENGRLNFNNIANNINDMNYKLWLENPPLKLEELKEMIGKPVWDNKKKAWLLINRFIGHLVFVKVEMYYDFEICDFEEGRFYRKQVVE